MRRTTAGIALAAALGALMFAAPLPPRLVAERHGRTRMATMIAAELARPVGTPYPAPTAVAAPHLGRAEVLANAARGGGGGVNVQRIEAKLMRLGDWRRVDCCVGDPATRPDLWVWVVAWWADDFPPWSGQSLVGVHLTWRAAVWDALAEEQHGRDFGAYRAVPPPAWDDLPDYAGGA
jgi:hypothetical protein